MSSYGRRGGGGYGRDTRQHSSTGGPYSGRGGGRRSADGGGGYQGHGGGYHRGRGRGDRGGRGFHRGGRGGRGRGRGRGRGGGRGRRMQPIARFHDVANEALQREVLELNQDSPGPQQIRVLKFHGSHWEAVESLTRGNYYYHNREREIEKSKKPTDLKDERVVKTEYRPYTISYAERPKVWPTKRMRLITVKTNSFLVNSRILDTIVHQFEVSFEPPIESENVSFREKVVLGGSHKERRRNGEQLRSVFGEFQFDNHALYAMGAKRPHGPVLMTDLHKDYKVAFYCIDNFKLSDPNIPIQQQEALLNIFNRQKLQAAKYTRIGRGWFPRGTAAKEKTIVSPVRSCPDVNIIKGYECSMRILPRTDVECVTVFKADLSHKLVEKNTLNVKLDLMRRSCHSEADFKELAEKELLGKHFLLSYNKKNLQIARIDWDQSEKSTFELQSGGRISYKDYLKATYGCKSPKAERCVILDKGEAAFLPQQMRLTLTSKQTDAVAEEILCEVNPPTTARLERIQRFVEHINAADSEIKSKKVSAAGGKRIALDTGRFKIEEDSLVTPAFVLTMPNIVIQGERGPMPSRPVDELKYKFTRGFLGEVQQLRQWGIVFEPGAKNACRDFIGAWAKYCSKRQFDRRMGPVLEPEPRPVRDLLDTRCYDAAVRRGDQFIILILDEGMRGSEMKARFTKHVQSAAFHNPVKVQCVQVSTCRNSSACINVFEDIMIKLGNVPYRIDPNLPNGERFIDCAQTWVCGMDVSHVKGKPSTAMMSLARDPFEGSLRSMHFVSHLNPSRKEIVAFPNMVSLFYHLISDGFQATVREKRRLPKAIVVFRDGVADGQLAELFTKEVVGIQRALAKFRDDNKLKKKWKPQLEYILCNKNVIDRFGLWDDRSQLVRKLQVPCVVYDHVLSYRLWDFIIYPFHRAKKEDRTRGVRYIVLLDQMKLASRNELGAGLDLFQFIFGLTYMFAFSIPFPLGGTAQPAPVQYAKHYAESFSQMIFCHDSSLRGLSTARQLPHRPKIVTTNILAPAPHSSAAHSAHA